MLIICFCSPLLPGFICCDDLCWLLLWIIDEAKCEEVDELIKGCCYAYLDEPKTLGFLEVGRLGLRSCFRRLFWWLDYTVKRRDCSASSNRGEKVSNRLGFTW